PVYFNFLLKQRLVRIDFDGLSFLFLFFLLDLLFLDFLLWSISPFDLRSFLGRIGGSGFRCFCFAHRCFERAYDLVLVHQLEPHLSIENLRFCSSWIAASFPVSMCPASRFFTLRLHTNILCSWRTSSGLTVVSICTNSCCSSSSNASL